MKNLYILRGVPGCGKSTVGNTLVNKSEHNVAADDYFYKILGCKSLEDYTEMWTNNIGNAHKWCYNTIENFLEEGIQKVCVSNTNTRSRDVKGWRELAIKYGYMPIVMVVENYHGGENSHGVPIDKLESMENALKSNLKLR